jgi:hypothetical protein
MAVFKESVPTIAVVNKTGEPKYNLKWALKGKKWLLC